MKESFPRTRTLPALAARLLPALLLFSLLGTVLAHAHVHGSTPENQSVVTLAPETVTLQFTEAVEALFSRFELVRLGDLAAAEQYGADGAAWQALDATAHDLSHELEEGNSAAPATSVELRLVSGGTGTEVQLQVVGDLTPGDYMLFFNVLSVDTHSSAGYVVFSYQPEQ